jgi:acetate CoA/acetoacetate CoA-transferase alpha subunit
LNPTYMKNKIKDIKEAVAVVKDGDTVMVGGFLQCGNPQHLVRALTETSARNLTLISSDTGSMETTNYGLLQSGKVKKIYASYIGGNPEAGNFLISGEAEVILVPQGTLAEKIRAGGAGIGGYLSPVGLGTVVEEGKQKITVDGKEYLLELPLKANVAFVKADTADRSGNLRITGSARNFNVVMATAAEHVVAEVSEIVETGEIAPDDVTIPAIFVDAIVKI